MDEKELENFRQVIQNLSQDLNNLGQSLNDNAAKTNAAASASTKASQASTMMAEAQLKAKKSEEDFTLTKERAKKALQEFAKSSASAALSNDSSMAKYSAGLQNAGNAIGDFAGQFGILGKTTEFLIKGFVMAADAVMKQNDAIFKSYDELGKLGVTLGTSTEEVLQLGIKAGYSSKNLESLYKSAKSLDSGLVALGGSASGGVKAFAEIANVGEQARNNFRALGYSQEEVTEMQANYVKQLSTTGGTLAKTPRQLSEESQKYITNLTALAEITGKSVKEQQKAQEVAMQQRNLNAYVNNLEDKRANAIANGNKAEAERLEKQISSTKAYAAHVIATEDAETAAAKLESLATDGAVVYTKNNSALAGMGYNFDKVNEALRRGESPMKMYFINAEENNKVQKQAKAMFGENLYRLGETSIGLQKFAGQSNEARAAQASYNKYLTLSEEERKKVDRMTSEEAIKYLTEEKAQHDERNELRNKQQEAEMEFKQAMDQLTSLLGKAVMPVLKIFADVLMLVAKGIKGFVELIHVFGDKFEELKDFFDDFVMSMRENPITRKLFGLSEVSSDEKKKYEEDKARRVTERNREIAERKAIYAGTPAQAEEKGTGSAQTEAQRLTGQAAPPISQNVKQNLGDIKASLKKRGITDEKYINAVLGNVMKETGGKAVNENLDYSKTSNDRIRSIFGARAKGKSDAELDKIKKDPQQMAEMMYGKDTQIGKGMGNTEPGDGWKFRGRGYIQLTGKNNYAAASKAIFNDDTLVKNPDLVNDPKVAADVVAWYMEKGKSAMAKKMGFDEKNMSQQEANLLATSQVAGTDVRKAGGYLGGEVMQKVTSYAGSADVQQAAGGGMFSGPATGYPVTLHGNEMVIPADFKIPNFAESIKSTKKTDLPKDLMASVASMFDTQKTSMSSMVSNTMEKITTSSSTTTQEPLSDVMAELMEMMESKFDDLISAVQDGNDTSDKLLQVSRV